ncbi:MAG: tetratricopeptide repeat protein [Niveispirillum sp.]|uniref:class I SAM-dependent methyltransferase n=1 Tax=Niveispirillum sp. TaxID=1917217 RepID=UPI003BA6639D
MDLDSLLSHAYAALTAGGRLDEATALFRRALDLAPDDPRALIGRAITLRAHGFPTQAETILRALLDRDPGNADAWAQLGTTLRLLNRLPESGAALEKALDLAPGHAYARTNFDYLGRFWRRGDVIQIDYPPSPRVRHGHGRPAHPRLAALLAAGDYAAAAQALAAIAPALATIPDSADPAHLGQPWWDNAWFFSGDAGMLCALLASQRPARLLEIGSGMSTRFARWAISRFATGTHLHSIDPEPRAEIDSLCDRITRTRLEDADPTLFTTLQAGDILFFDGSHRSFQNSDVTVFFTEILPDLAPGVIVQIHDIFLPDDYPPDWLGRLYNEQYLLASLLLAGQTRFEILWPGAFAPTLPAIGPLLPARFRDGRGSSFWMRVR